MSDNQSNKTLVMGVGLPRSGKTTALRRVSKNKGYPVVNPDSIRLALYGQPFITEMEEFVWFFAKKMVISLFEAGHDTVILDATNTRPEKRKYWESDKWNIEYWHFTTDKETCIQRAKDTNKEYLIPVIEKMAAEFDISDITDSKLLFKVRIEDNLYIYHQVEEEI